MTFVVLILAAGYVLTSYLSPTSVRLAQDRQFTDVLNLTREAVISATVSASGASERPGNMPRPDVVADTVATKNYNGDAETGCFDQSKSNGLPLIIDHINIRCLGRFPWRSFGLSNTSFSENDPTGTMPWYAVSGNLAFQRCVEFLNPDILAFSYTGHICPADSGVTPTSLPYPWLTVRDGRGVVLSNRVAVVIIVPGPAINGQMRPTSPNLLGPNQYLDSVTITVTNVTAECPGPPCTLTFNNADLDNDFVQTDRSESFNDRLIYITIDELMEKIEIRAGQEIRASVQRFRQQFGSYPWLAPFNNPSIANYYKAVTGTRVGLVPIHQISQQFETEFSWRITNGNLEVFPGTVDADVVRNDVLRSAITNGKCKWNGMVAVECEGEILVPESIKKPNVRKRIVQIEYPVSWDASVVSVTHSPATATTVTTRSVIRPNGSLAKCLLVGLTRCVIVTDYDASGNVVGKGSLRFGTGSLTISKIRLYPDLPAWVTENRWHEFAIGAIALGWVPGAAGVCPCLTVNLDGGVERSDVSFLVLMAGAKLTRQARPSANPNDYFDSAYNRDVVGGQTFERQTTPTGSFNDRLYY